LILLNSIQSIYQSQGVNISNRHIEIIVRQMTAKVKIKESGDTPLLPGELIKLPLILEIQKSLLSNAIKYKSPQYEPVVLSTTTSSLGKDGFLANAGFQETKKVLTKAAVEGSRDWLRGLKECIIVGRLIPAGSSFLNYKSYLDNIYFFKN
jgi:DNA-directed RNA polymerase subunit beta'